MINDKYRIFFISLLSWQKWLQSGVYVCFGIVILPALLRDPYSRHLFDFHLFYSVGFVRSLVYFPCRWPMQCGQRGLFTPLHQDHCSFLPMSLSGPHDDRCGWEDMRSQHHQCPSTHRAPSLHPPQTCGLVSPSEPCYSLVPWPLDSPV